MWEREHVITCDLKKEYIRLYSILCKNYPFEMSANWSIWVYLNCPEVFFRRQMLVRWGAVFHSTLQSVYPFLTNKRETARHRDPSGLWTLVTCSRHSEWPSVCMRALLNARMCLRAVARPHTPSLSPSFRSRQTVALETQRAPVCWKWKFFQLYLFICLISFPLSVARIEQTRRLSSEGRNWNEL